MAVYTVMGVGGSPFRSPFGSFVNKPPSGSRVYTQIFTVMGVGGAPYRPPFGSFANKPGSSATKIYSYISSSYIQ